MGIYLFTYPSTYQLNEGKKQTMQDFFLEPIEVINMLNTGRSKRCESNGFVGGMHWSQSFGFVILLCHISFA